MSTEDWIDDATHRVESARDAEADRTLDALHKAATPAPWERVYVTVLQVLEGGERVSICKRSHGTPLRLGCD